MLRPEHIAFTLGKANEACVVPFQDYRISVLTDALFRVEKGDFTDEATQMVFFRNFPVPKFTVKEKKNEVEITTAAVKLTVKTPLESSTVRFLTGALKGKTAALDNKENLRGTYRTLDGCDGAYLVPEKRNIELGYGVLSKNGAAYLEDDSLLLLSDGKPHPRAKGTDRYFFCYGHDYKAALSAFYALTGNVPQVPRFALGNWWSRYHAYSAEEYLATMRRLKKRRVPVSVTTVDMDWHISNEFDALYRKEGDPAGEEYVGTAGGWTGYTWNEKLFPDHRAFLKELHDEGYHVTLNLHPADGVRYMEAQYEDFCRRMGKDPKDKKRIPFNLVDDDFLNAYFDLLHHPYEKEGVDFWWIDWQQGTKSAMDGLDPLWALNHYHYLDNKAGHGQGLILSRYAGPGSHRYPLGFSGDTAVTWKSLDYTPYFTATAANIGYTWWSHDIGAHMWGTKDDELYARYVQFGVFSPINRLHCSALVVATKEPRWYGAPGRVAEDFLRLRHAMVPMLYTADVEASEKRLPLLRPLYFDYPEDKGAYAVKNEYLFLGKMIVAPVTEKCNSAGYAKTEVYLPEGVWTDFFTGAVYEVGKGGKKFTAYRPLTRLPVFFPQGGIAVLSDGEEADCSLPKALRVKLFPGTGEYTLIEDANGKRATTRFSLSGNDLFIHTEGQTEILPKNRTVTAEFVNFSAESITVNGKEARVRESFDGNPEVTFPLVSSARLTATGTVLTKEQANINALKILFTESEGGYDPREALIRAILREPKKAKELILKADCITLKQKQAYLEIL